MDAIERRKELAAARVIAPPARLALARAVNAIAALRARAVAVSPDAIATVVDAARRLGVEPKDMLAQAALLDITREAEEQAKRGRRQLERWMTRQSGTKRSC